MAWERLGERLVYDGYRRLVARRYRLPDGTEREFEVKAEGPTAVVVALTPERRVILVREFRPGVEEVLLELPGGEIDPGEEPAAAAARELLEETGYAGEVVALGSMVDCAYSTRIRHVFAARGCRRVAEPTAEDAQLGVELVDVPAFREHLRSGRCTDVGPGYLALDRLGLL
ncbi:MAG TPA: NUDIX domain-containing protein [Gaiellaceae bacterium]|nr:NUDIX domain-containing protein [Gaiellaceae bacterium]